MDVSLLGKIAPTVLILLGKQQQSSTSDTAPQIADHTRTAHLISFADNGQYLAIGNSVSFFLLSLDEQSKEYRLVSRVSGLFGDNETITCLCCLDVNSLDGTQLVFTIVGYSNGNMRIFSKKGKMLQSQIFHPTQITRIEMHRILDKNELLLYHEGCCIVSFDFNSIINELVDESQNTITWDHKKWRIPTAVNSTSIVVCIGPLQRNKSISLYTNPILGQLSNNCSPPLLDMKPMVNRFIRIGSNPMISYHVAKGSQGLLSASNIASIVTTSLSSFAKSFLKTSAGGTGPSTFPQTQNIAPPVSIDSVFEMKDSSRTFIGFSLAPPSYHLAALTDGFGRVWLFDTVECEFIRIWKGIRDAQCSWIEMDISSDEGDASNGQVKRALILLIYAPKRNGLQAYRMKFGNRVVAMPFEFPGCRLFTINMRSRMKMAKSLMYSPDGCIYELQIPISLLMDSGNVDSSVSKDSEMEAILDLDPRDALIKLEEYLKSNKDSDSIKLYLRIVEFMVKCRKSISNSGDVEPSIDKYDKYCKRFFDKLGCELDETLSTSEHVHTKTKRHELDLRSACNMLRINDLNEIDMIERANNDDITDLAFYVFGSNLDVDKLFNVLVDLKLNHKLSLLLFLSHLGSKLNEFNLMRREEIYSIMRLIGLFHRELGDTLVPILAKSAEFGDYVHECPLLVISSVVAYNVYCKEKSKDLEKLYIDSVNVYCLQFFSSINQTDLYYSLAKYETMQNNTDKIMIKGERNTVHDSKELAYYFVNDILKLDRDWINLYKAKIFAENKNYIDSSSILYHLQENQLLCSVVAHYFVGELYQPFLYEIAWIDFVNEKPSSVNSLFFDQVKELCLNLNKMKDLSGNYTNCPLSLMIIAKWKKKQLSNHRLKLTAFMACTLEHSTILKNYSKKFSELKIAHYQLEFEDEDELNGQLLEVCKHLVYPGVDKRVEVTDEILKVALELTGILERDSDVIRREYSHYLYGMAICGEWESFYSKAVESTNYVSDIQSFADETADVIVKVFGFCLHYGLKYPEIKQKLAVISVELHGFVKKSQKESVNNHFSKLKLLRFAQKQERLEQLLFNLKVWTGWLVEFSPNFQIRSMIVEIEDALRLLTSK